MKDGLTNTLLVIFASMFVLALSEFFLQLADIGRYSLEDRVLFYSSPSFVRYGNHAVAYQPNSKVRMTAIYGSDVDFDTIHRTNNMGFFDTVDYHMEPPSVRDIVFVGDSFTAGSGGARSFPHRYRELLAEKDTAVYNLGVAATGVDHFEHALYESAKSIDIDEINIVLITSDLFRPLWYPLDEGDGVRLCRSEQSMNECRDEVVQQIHRSSIDEDVEALKLRAEELYRSRRVKRADGVAASFIFNTSLYTLYCDARYSFDRSPSLIDACPHLKVYKTGKYKKNARYDKSIRTLERIQKSFPRAAMRVIHIPMKGEIKRGSYALRIGDDVESKGIEFISVLDECDLLVDMYHRNDSHPKDEGYEEIANCLYEVIEGSETS